MHIISFVEHKNNTIAHFHCNPLIIHCHGVEHLNQYSCPRHSHCNIFVHKHEMPQKSLKHVVLFFILSYYSCCRSRIIVLIHRLLDIRNDNNQLTLSGQHHSLMSGPSYWKTRHMMQRNISYTRRQHGHFVPSCEPRGTNNRQLLLQKKLSMIHFRNHIIIL